MGTENIESCSQRDSAERKGYVRAHRSFNRIWKERDSAEPDLLGKILDRDNLNRAYKRVKANKGAPGVDGMTIEAALPWLKEHNQKLTERIRRGKYTPTPVRRVEIPKPDGGKRKLGIPTVIDRIIQQAMLQQLMPIYEPLFSDDSFGYRPGRGAKDAIYRIKEYIEQGYIRAVVLDLSRYFDTLNHTILLNLLRKQVKDERVIQMVKRYLKGGVMENGVETETEEGSPQGGNLSPLLANVYLNEFDWEFHRRGVPCIRYADNPYWRQQQNEPHSAGTLPRCKSRFAGSFCRSDLGPYTADGPPCPPRCPPQGASMQDGQSCRRTTHRLCSGRYWCSPAVLHSFRDNVSVMLEYK